MPYPAQYGCLTERGTLFYNGKTPSEPDRFMSDKPYKIGAVMEVDWNGRVLWEVRHPDHHHDGIRLRNGNVLLLASPSFRAIWLRKSKVEWQARSITVKCMVTICSR